MNKDLKKQFIDKGIKDILKRSKFEEDILEVIYNQENYTTSDLQGRVSAIVLGIISAYKGEK